MVASVIEGLTFISSNLSIYLIHCNEVYVATIPMKLLLEKVTSYLILAKCNELFTVLNKQLSPCTGCLLCTRLCTRHWGYKERCPCPLRIFYFMPQSSRWTSFQYVITASVQYVLRAKLCPQIYVLKS